MLDGTGDAERDVQLRGNGLTRLAHLELRRVEAGVDGCTGRTDSGAESVGQRLDDLAEVLLRADTATTGDDDLRLGELRPVAALDRAGRGDLRCTLGRGNLDADDLAGAGILLGLNGARAKDVHRAVARGLGLNGVGATEDRVNAVAAVLDPHEIGEETGAGARGDAAADLAALERCGKDDAGGAVLRKSCEHVDLGSHHEIGDVRALGDIDLLGAGGGERILEALCGALGTEDDGGRLTQGASSGEQLLGHILQFAVDMLDDNKYFCHEFYSLLEKSDCGGIGLVS